MVVPIVYLSVVLAWGEARTNGIAYYGLPPMEREAFRRSLRRHALLLHPVLLASARLSKFRLSDAGFRFEDISGPKGTCTPDSFAAGRAYEPRPEDVFVVTQMKCGTTWMQHLVYEIVMRGHGDIVERGTTLYAVSPWLESTKSVSVQDAAPIGVGRPARIIKTHLPSHLCPTSQAARYIYVTRHPVSCFASCVDFLSVNLGVFKPELTEVEDWFCSDELMWWGTWPAHVAGWRRRADDHANVLWVEFEDMKRNLGGVAARVAQFLGVSPLNPDELADVVRKCGFDYMQANQIAFEMHPPHLLAVDAELFVRGAADRYRDVGADVNERIMSWCTERLGASVGVTERSFPTPAQHLR